MEKLIATAIPRSGEPFEVELEITGPVRAGCAAHPEGSESCLRCVSWKLGARLGDEVFDVGAAIRLERVTEFAEGFAADGIAWPYW